MSPNPIAPYRFAWPILLALSSGLGAWFSMNGFRATSPEQRFAVLEQMDTRLAFRVDSVLLSIEAHEEANRARDLQLVATIDALMVLGCVRTSEIDLKKTRLLARCRATLEGAVP